MIDKFVVKTPRKKSNDTGADVNVTAFNSDDLHSLLDDNKESVFLDINF